MLEAGATVGRYRLVEKLDSRAGGARFRALDSQGNRPVVLAVPPVARFPTAEARQAFEAAARRIATLDHPNLVRLLDVLVEDERPLLIAEWVEGVPLDEALGSRRLPMADATRVARDLARALSYIHVQRLTHGRLTTSSVVVDRQSGAGRIWDLAILGDPAGTMSADLKALGAILSRMLVGQEAGVGMPSASALPEPLARLLERLGKPDAGLTAAEVVEALDPARLSGRVRSSGVRITGSRPLWRDGRAIAGAAVSLVVIVGLGIWLVRPRTADEAALEEEAPPVAAPEQSPPPKIDRAAIERAAATFVAATPCGDLAVRVDEAGVLAVEGVVAGTELSASLEERLATIPNVARVQSALTVRAAPHCLAAESILIRASPTHQPPELRLSHPDGVYRLGEYFVAEIRMPATLPGLLYVDLFTEDGQVTHLLPEPLRTVNVLAAGETIRIGVEEQNRQEGVRDWRVDPPVGSAWLVLTAVERPIYSGLLPITQPMGEYMDRIVAALDDPATGARSVRIQRLEFRDR